jgi:multiple sugar transport system permease protein
MSAVARTSRYPALRSRTLIISVLAYGIAAIFVLPYLEMVVSALRPTNQLLAANLLPNQTTAALAFVYVQRRQPRR